jgi:hypothetical protein
MACGARTHIAVVPVTGLDTPTERALAYAGRLAPRVLAVHLRDGEGDRADDVERTWAVREARVPLVVLDARPHERQRVLRRMLELLRRSEAADLITLVVPPGAGVAERLPRGVVVQGVPE